MADNLLRTGTGTKFSRGEPTRPPADCSYDHDRLFEAVFIIDSTMPSATTGNQQSRDRAYAIHQGSGCATRESSPRRLLPIRRSLLPILFSLSACDNVQWGGTDLEIVPPPPSSVLAPPVADQQASVEMGLPTGPVLFHLIKGSGGSTLIPVAELSGDSLKSIRRPEKVDAATFERRLRETVLPVGAQFRLFRRGAPVGTFVVQAPGSATTCGLPTATGYATVVAAAADESEFLAFALGLSPEVRGQYSPPQMTGAITTYASIVAERLILQAGLPRPRSWVGAQKDMDPIQIIAGGHPEMSATYMVGDSLRVGPGDPTGYSIFYIADYETARGYNPVYTEVRDYRKTGKQAPALVDYVNWNGQPGEDLLLRVFGRTDSWYEAISRRRGRWERVWQGQRCR